MPCMVAALTLVGCYDTMDDKASIDAKYQGAYSNPTISITSAVSPDFQSMEVTAAVGDAAAVVEQGVEFASDADFEKIVTVYVNDTVTTSFTAAIGGLSELTTLYVRAYAVGRNGVTVFTQGQELTSQAAPLISIEGTYTAQEYAGDSDTGNWAIDTETPPYKITIAFEEGSTEVVNITNIWDGEMTVQGMYDEETQTITVPNYQNIYLHKTYGDVWLRGLNADFSGYSDAVVFKFNPRGGAMQSTPMAAQCSAGNFSFFYLVMQHD